MFCLYCGTNLPDDAVFCNKCGKQQNVSSNELATGVTILPFVPLPEALTGSGQPAAGNVPMVQGTSSTLDSSSGQSFVQSAANSVPFASPPSALLQTPSSASLTPTQHAEQQTHPAEQQLRHQMESHTHPPHSTPTTFPHIASPPSPTHDLHTIAQRVPFEGLKLTGHPSRRTFMVGLAVATVAVAGGGFTWLVLSQAASSLAQRATLYSGTWLNDNPNTRDIPKLEISNVGPTLTVHGYGACEPTYCDWGTRSKTFIGDPFTIEFIFDNGASTVHLSMVLEDDEGTMLSVTDNYTTESFHKEGS